MASPTFKSSLTITFIGTATAVLDIGGTTFLTDPFFSPAGTEWDVGVTVLKVHQDPGLQLSQLPPIDAVLLSHEDHPDNLDSLGRQLLDGRRVFTTRAGAKALAPRPGVAGMAPWETRSLAAAGGAGGGSSRFDITATPCVHLPGGECTGFLVHAEEFGETGGLPNAIWFSGDTVYVEELREIGKRYHVCAAIMNLGAAKVAGGDAITMGGRDAARLFGELGADVLVPMHYEAWGHFTEDGKALEKVFNDAGVGNKVCWLRPGEKKKVL